MSCVLKIPTHCKQMAYLIWFSRILKWKRSITPSSRGKIQSFPLNKIYNELILKYNKSTLKNNKIYIIINKNKTKTKINKKNRTVLGVVTSRRVQLHDEQSNYNRQQIKATFLRWWSLHHYIYRCVYTTSWLIGFQLIRCKCSLAAKLQTAFLKTQKIPLYYFFHCLICTKKTFFVFRANSEEKKLNKYKLL